MTFPSVVALTRCGSANLSRRRRCEVRSRHARKSAQRDEAAEARAEEEPVSIAEEHDGQVSKCRTHDRLRGGLRNWRSWARGKAVSADETRVLPGVIEPPGGAEQAHWR